MALPASLREIARWPALHSFLAGLLAAVTLVVLMDGAIHRVPTEWWSDRDDGLITLSHAKNLVLYGFVGVNPSGERVEGFSAPLQFLTAVLAFAVSPGLDYATFNVVSTRLWTLVLGAGLFWLFFRLTHSRLLGAFLAVAAGVIADQSDVALEWHYSGMENCSSHAMVVLLLACVVDSVQRERVTVGVVGVGILASLCRIEAISHVLPIVIAGAIVVGSGPGRRRVAVAREPALLIAGWFILFALRAAYFRDWISNTAYAEQISVDRNLRALLTPAGLATGFALTHGLFQSSHAILVLIALPLLLLGAHRISDSERAVLFVLTIAILSGLAHPYLFGPGRLDPSRTVSWMSWVTAIFFLVTLWSCVRSVALASALVLALYPLRAVLPFEARPLKYPPFEDIRAKLGALAAADDLPRPLVALADLGAVSFSKEFDVTDLGLLGSTVLARHAGDPQFLVNYILELAQPDLIELHGPWSCFYAGLFSDERFTTGYAAVEETRGADLDANCADHPAARAGIYVRRATSKGARTRERLLLDDLRQVDAEKIVREIEANASPNWRDYVYLVMAGYRFAPELRTVNGLEPIAAAIERKPISEEAKAWARAVLFSYRGESLNAATTALLRAH